MIVKNSISAREYRARNSAQFQVAAVAKLENLGLSDRERPLVLQAVEAVTDVIKRDYHLIRRDDAAAFPQVLETFLKQEEEAERYDPKNAMVAGLDMLDISQELNWDFFANINS